jgi:isoleucyl-tRNA synthetase
MVRWLAPILSFTAEEIWQALPALPGRPESVFLSQWHVLPAAAAGGGVDWDAVIALKADVSRELEALRGQGLIGGTLDAVVDVWAEPAVHARLAPLGDELRFALITSEARLHDATARPAHAVPAASVAKAGVYIEVRPSTERKCMRCWHLRPDVGRDPRHPEVCARCAANVEGPGETRRFA